MQPIKKTAQPLMGDRRLIAQYEGSEHVPYPLERALTPEELAPFADTRVLVTFTVRVPLELVVHGGKLSAILHSHIEQGFLSRHTMCSIKYRAVGASFDDFDETFDGYVHLQVTCMLRKPS